MRFIYLTHADICTNICCKHWRGSFIHIYTTLSGRPSISPRCTPWSTKTHYCNARVAVCTELPQKRNKKRNERNERILRRIRATFGIHNEDYLRSVGPEQLLGNMAGELGRTSGKLTSWLVDDGWFPTVELRCLATCPPCRNCLLRARARSLKFDVFFLGGFEWHVVTVSYEAVLFSTTLPMGCLIDKQHKQQCVFLW